MTFKSIALLVAVAFFVENRSAGQVVTAVPAQGIPDVSFIGPSDAGFAARILALRTVAMDTPAFRTLFDYSIVIQNRGSRAIAAYAVRYDYVGSSGLPEVSTFLRDNRWVGSKVAAGESRIVTPFGGVDQMTDTTSDGILSRLRFLLNASNIAVSLDSVLFADGQLVGPDTYKLREKLEAQTRATEAFVAELRQLDGEPDSVLLAKLDAVTAASKTPRQSPFENQSDVIVDRVRHRTGMDALRLRTTLAKSGRAKYEEIRQALVDRDTTIRINE